MPFSTTISAEGLSKNIENKNWLILDCRGALLSDKSSYKTYSTGHIPNAYYFTLREVDKNNDHKDQVSPDFAIKSIMTTLELNGFDSGSQIIIYDNENTPFINDLWLLLRHSGFKYIAVLEGGFKYWQEKNYPIIEKSYA